MAAGGPLNLSIEGSSKVSVADILVGEVWVCSGQSNMEWTVAASGNPEQEIAQGNHPQIRHFKVNHAPADQPQHDVATEHGWQAASSQTVGEFTAAGYYFARELHRQLGVPIGIIGSNWGGTRIEPWTPPQGFRQVPALQELADRLDSFPEKNDQGAVIHQSPLALYNGMIHPLIPYSVRGAIWYQGESNVGEGMQYAEKMRALIGGWREVWNNPRMPFYYVQLAPFRYNKEQQLPEIWEAQLAALSIPYTGMAVTTDIGDVGNIHPANKQEVGRRLALWALVQTYGRDDLVCSGPLLLSGHVEGHKIRLSFGFAHGLTTRDDQPIRELEIAGEDGKFAAAQTKIDGNDILCWSDEVAEPVQVRLGWSEQANPNLVNAAGLPASPFRWKRD
jgi:sialate O-acetylesterase